MDRLLNKHLVYPTKNHKWMNNSTQLREQLHRQAIEATSRMELEWHLDQAIDNKLQEE